MNDELVNVKIKEHTEAIKEHDKRIDKIEQDGREFKIEIKNLCDNLKNLVNTSKWLCGLIGSSLLGFFFYAIQKMIFK